MAAHTTPAGNSQQSSHNIDKRCNFLSEEFDPLTALYSLNVNDVPRPGIAPFSNLNEYSNAVKGLTAAQRRKKQDLAAKSDASASKTDQKKPVRHWENIIKPEILQQVKATTTGTINIEKSLMIQQKRKVKKDIFKGFEAISTSGGPLSVLHKAMKERLQVKVWTRSARQIRGFSVGFIIAFDKHWNLAMVDVDETYCQPCLPRTSFTLPKQVLLQMKRENRLFKATSSRTNTPTPPPTAPISTSITEAQAGTISESLPTQESLKCENLLDVSGRGRTQPVAASRESLFWSEQSADCEKQGPSKNDKTFVVPGSEGYGSSDRQKLLRFPRGREVKGKIHGLSGRIFIRHLNQVFVRGDNIVLVQIIS